MPQTLSHEEKRFRRELKRFLENTRPGSDVTYLPMENGQWSYQITPPIKERKREYARGYGGRFVSGPVQIVEDVNTEIKESEEEIQKGVETAIQVVALRAYLKTSKESLL